MEARLPMVYISGALSDMTEGERERLRKFYEDLATVCERVGFRAYLPHRISDPKQAPDITPEQVDEIDRAAVAQAWLMVMYAGRPSFGPGIELEIANHANTRVIILFEEELLKTRRISRLVRGNPAVEREIVFTSFEEACAGLEHALRLLIEGARASILPDILTP